MFLRRILMALGLFVLSTVGAHAQNVVVNGGFENGLTGWTVTGSPWTAGDSVSSAPRSGVAQAYSACSLSTQSCVLSQTISNLNPGKYTFTVYAISPDSAGTFRATVGGTDIFNGPFSQGTGQNTNNVNYRMITGQVTLGTSTTISFGGYNNAQDLAIDDVSLFRTGAAPEPATWGLMMLGFGIIGAALRTRRRRLVLAA